MAVLDRSELKASPLADLHAIADQLGLEGFRRLRREELIDAILAAPGGGVEEPGGGAEEPGGGAEEPATGVQGDRAGEQEDGSAEESKRRSSRLGRLRRARPARAGAEEHEPERSEGEEEPERDATRATRAAAADDARRAERERGGEANGRSRDEDEEASAASPAGRGRERRGGSASAREQRPGRDRTAEGVVELLGNGSAFLRVDPPEASDEDAYISAAQVRRCELVSGDRVAGPVRPPRRSERYPSLVRVETINGAPAGEVSEGARYEDRPVAYPSERLALDGGGDATMQAIEWLTPFGRGSRVVIAGPARAGKTEILKRLLGSFAPRDDLEVSLALTGVRPEEIAEWQEGPVTPATALTFAASPDARVRALEHVVETAARTAARGPDALVLIDTLTGLHPHTARKVLAFARNLSDGGSSTIVATAAEPVGGETTVIALDPTLAADGGPSLDLIASGTLRAELLVGEEGAAAIAKARSDAMGR
jgi:transcription termination factor Rho